MNANPEKSAVAAMKHAGHGGLDIGSLDTVNSVNLVSTYAHRGCLPE